jgi:SAM-dependent methyltransferase
MTMQYSNTTNNKWLASWTTKEHQDKKKMMFNIVDSNINFSPKNILDIGCGLAIESEMFQLKYNSNLYLLDGDFDTTSNRSRDTNYGTSDSMAFYSKIDDLKKSWNSRNLQYNFIDANNINIPSSVKFDLIYSFESCGFHYPVNTYAELIKKHSHKDTVLIFDIRIKTYAENKQYFNELKILHTDKKFKTVSLGFK